MHNLKRWLLPLVVVGPLLVGCATGLSNNTVCPPIFPYSPAEQTAAADELARMLREGYTAIPDMIADYAATRDALRTCQ